MLQRASGEGEYEKPGLASSCCDAAPGRRSGWLPTRQPAGASKTGRTFSRRHKETRHAAYGQDNQLWFFGDLPAEGISKAKAEAVKGLEIDDKLADAQLGLCT